MKKELQILGLASTLVLSSVGVSHAGFKVKINDNTYGSIGTQIRIFYLNNDKDTSHNYRYNKVEVGKFRISTKGQVNKLIQFYSIVDTSSKAPNAASLTEAGLQFKFSPIFIVKIGKIRVPFSRHNLTSRYVSPVMSSNGDIFLPDQFKDALKAVNPYPGGYKTSQPFKRTDFGTVIAGEINKGLFKYYVGIFNDDRSATDKVWNGTAWTSAATTGSVGDKKGFEYDVRLEFTPTFLGFKSESTVFNPAMREAQTYLGKFDTMTFGIGFHYEKHLDNLNSATYGVSSLTRKGLALDFSIEKKLANVYITGMQLGYMKFWDTHLYQVGTTYKKGDVWTWYLGGHVIYGEKVGMGYPGVGFRYEYISVDGKYGNKSNLAYDRLGVCFSYWFTRKIRIATGVDFVNAKDALKAYFNSKNYKDSTKNFYVGLYANF